MKSYLVLIRFGAIFMAATLVGVLSGCGQRGPLYLPGKPEVTNTPAKNPPMTPASPTSDSITTSK